MNALDIAILRTILYADVFNFAMTEAEIHHYLIGPQPVSRETVHEALMHSPALRANLHCEDGYIARAGHAHLIAQRRQRAQSSAYLWPLALRSGVWLARLPFVRMVAITGALAVHNAASEADDLDFMLVTAPGRVWIARAFAVMLVRLGHLRGVTICPNYVLAEIHLEQERKDLYIAHEITQMIPVYGHDLYWRMRAINRWTDAHLPNADRIFFALPDHPPGRAWGWLKWMGERLLGGGLGDRLEAWEHRRKLRRFERQLHQAGSAAALDANQVKGHFEDYGMRVLAAYQQRLHQHGLADE